jgi:hypothetical protein
LAATPYVGNCFERRDSGEWSVVERANKGILMIGSWPEEEVPNGHIKWQRFVIIGRERGRLLGPVAKEENVKDGDERFTGGFAKPQQVSLKVRHYDVAGSENGRGPFEGRKFRISRFLIIIYSLLLN